MFEFKAHFCDEQVFISGKSYLCNEILTTCLNLKDENLRGILQELTLLRKNIQLQEGGDEEFCVRYDEHVTQAQQLFYTVGRIVTSLPPYDNMHLTSTLDSPLLCDLLNKNFYWVTGKDTLNDEDDPRFRNEDYCNKFGFVTKDEYGRYGFYVQHFFPDFMDLNSNDPDLVLMIHETNDALCSLFDEYITLVCDLIRVQDAYSELLDRFIHRSRKFLTETEVANCFVGYLHQTGNRKDPDKVSSSGTMQMGYEVFRLPDGANRLCETYSFDSLGAFLYVDFFRGLSRCYIPKRCENCEEYFLLTAGKYSSYCEKPLKDDPEKTCRDIGARKRYDDKCKTDPVWLAYNRAYKAHYARYMKKKMTTAQFEQWSRYAIELREQAEHKKLPQAEYERLIKI